jgi:hypothetical protein
MMDENSSPSAKIRHPTEEHGADGPDDQCRAVHRERR